MKKIVSGEEATKGLKAGVDAVANAVKITIGPRGKNVAIDKGFGGKSIITNDGDTIANSVECEDVIENMGASIIKEVANNTNESAGDGTTTSTILMQAIYAEGLKRISGGTNGLLVRKGIEQATADLIVRLKDMAITIDSFEQISSIATISAEDKDIGLIIANCIESVGKDGVVTVEESPVFGIESELVQGMEVDKGYITGYMITNNERLEAELTDVPVLVTDYAISSKEQLLAIMQGAKANGDNSMVLVCTDLSGEALALAVLNKIRGVFTLVAIRAPGFGDAQNGNLEDIAILTGATFITKGLAMPLSVGGEVKLGHIDRFVAGKDKSTITIDKKSDEVTERVTYLKGILENTEAEFERERLEERIARLSGGVGVIRVGAATEREAKYLKLKVDDAVNATKAAIEEGIVPGGGVALLLARKGMKVPDGEHEFKVGYEIVLKAIEAPIRQIAINALKDDGVVVNNVYENGLGYNALTDEYVDLVEQGIIDPVKVTRTALQNASSAAGILLTTEVVIANIPEKEQQLNY